MAVLKITPYIFHSAVCLFVCLFVFVVVVFFSILISFYGSEGFSS